VLQDAKVVDHACTALSRIAESYARHPDRLDMLCNHGLISNAVQLVRVHSCCRTLGDRSTNISHCSTVLSPDMDPSLPLRLYQSKG
jgi:hypothetical protein